MLSLYHENSHELNTCEAIRNYVEGGRGILTLLSPTGVHHTYAFYKPRHAEVFPDDVIFVYAVHEGQKLFYVGMIEQGIFRVTQNSRFLQDAPIVKGARYIVKMMKRPDLLGTMKVFHEGMCCRCGRKLTNPKSIVTGIGPRCRRLKHAAS